MVCRRRWPPLRSLSLSKMTRHALVRSAVGTRPRNKPATGREFDLQSAGYWADERALPRALPSAAFDEVMLERSDRAKFQRGRPYLISAGPTRGGTMATRANAKEPQDGPTAPGRGRGWQDVARHVTGYRVNTHLTSWLSPVAPHTTDAASGGGGGGGDGGGGEPQDAAGNKKRRFRIHTQYDVAGKCVCPQSSASRPTPHSPRCPRPQRTAAGARSAFPSLLVVRPWRALPRVRTRLTS
jgi:hypothetical protein